MARCRRGGSGAAAALTIGCLAVPSTAATRPLCLQIVDQQRDVSRSEVRGQPPRLDITSADVATTRDRIVAVVRLRGWAADGPGNADAAVETQFYVSFRSLKDSYALVAQVGADGAQYHGFATAHTEPGGGWEPSRMESGTGAIDLRRGLVRIEVPRSLFYDPKARQQLEQVSASSRTALDATGRADEAVALRPYADRTRTCIA